jgi:peroxiredoxin Q/BCP
MQRIPMPLEENIPAPASNPDSTDGKKISLADLKGQKIVLYFYPKDDTPGCTTEACNFRDSFADFKKAGAIILGISPDPIKSHDKFKTKFSLPFPLLADPDHAIAEKYDVWKEKSMYGKKYMGVERSTFIIDTAGNISKIFSKVKVPNHHEEVLEAIKAAS